MSNVLIFLKEFYHFWESPFLSCKLTKIVFAQICISYVELHQNKGN